MLQDGFRRSVMCYGELHGHNDPRQFVERPSSKAAFSNADVGKIVTIQGNQVTVDGKTRLVDWKQAAHSDCNGKIESVDENVLGAVWLTSGQGFPNPGETVHEFHDRGTYVVCACHASVHVCRR